MKKKKNKTYYVVFRMNRTLSVFNPETKESEETPLSGCAGYMPIFNTLKAAQKDSGGKYEIKAITATVINDEE